MSEAASANQRLVLEFFRLWSRVYDSPLFQWVYFGRVHSKLLDAANGLLPKNALDVGCGTGELLFKCAARWPNAHFTGVDLSPDMLAKARTKNYAAKVDLVEGSVYQLPFPDSTFDFVTNSISSHYYLEAEKACSEIARVLAPGGIFLQAVLTNGILRHVPGPWKDGFEIPGAVYPSPDRQEKLLQEAGLVVRHKERLPVGAWLFECQKP
ncbi:MAG: class I SAM-dependent methyltransferase [Bdellovibrionota bacterium]